MVRRIDSFERGHDECKDHKKAIVFSRLTSKLLGVSQDDQQMMRI